MVKINLRNIVLKDWNKYSFNDFFIFSNNNDGEGVNLECMDDENGTFESSQTIFRHALDLAFPEVILSAYCSEGYPIWVTRPPLSSSGCVIQAAEAVYEIQQDKMDHLNKWFSLLLDYTKSTRSNWGNLVSSWNVAFNEYNNAITSVRIEKAYVNLIDALESVLAKDNSEIRYKVSLYSALLYSDNRSERKRVFELIKKAYGIRSNVGAGVKFSKDDEYIETLYKEFLELKDIVSDILLKTYSIPKDEIINQIENNIFACNKIV